MTEQMNISKQSVSNLVGIFTYVYQYKLRKGIYKGNLIRCIGDDERFKELHHTIYYRKIKSGFMYDTYELIYISLGDLETNTLNGFDPNNIDFSDWVDVDPKHVKEHKRLTYTEIKCNLLAKNMESKVGWP